MEAEAAKKPARPVHVFQVPTSIGGDVREVGMVEITSNEEEQAEKRARGDRGKVAVELTKTSLVLVDGKTVSPGDGTVDTAWEKMVPKLRTLLVTTYTKLHIPNGEESEGFFSSMEVRV